MNETTFESIAQPARGLVRGGPCTDRPCDGPAFRDQFESSSREKSEKPDENSATKSREQSKSAGEHSAAKSHARGASGGEESNAARREVARERDGSDDRDDSEALDAAQTVAAPDTKTGGGADAESPLGDPEKSNAQKTAAPSKGSPNVANSAVEPDGALRNTGGENVEDTTDASSDSNTKSEKAFATRGALKSDAVSKEADAAIGDEATANEKRKLNASNSRVARASDANTTSVDAVNESTSPRGRNDGADASGERGAGRNRLQDARNGVEAVAKHEARAPFDQTTNPPSDLQRNASAASESVIDTDSQDVKADTKPANVEPNATRPIASPGRLTSSPVVERLLHASDPRAESATGGSSNGSQVDVDPTRFVGRVANAFRIAADRDGPLRLRLSPPELGSIRMEVAVKQGAMTASIEAETPSARRALLEHLPLLRDRLAEQGVRIERFDVDLRDDGSSGWRDDTAPGQEQRQGPHSEAPRRESSQTNESSEASPIAPPASRVRGDEVFNAVA